MALLWNNTTANPVQFGYNWPVFYNGYVYLTGVTVNGAQSTAVYYAPVNANGTIGVWNTTTARPLNNYATMNFAANGRLYVCGGSSSYTYNCYWATINSNGTLGAWNTLSSALSGLQSGAGVLQTSWGVIFFGGTGTTPMVNVIAYDVNPSTGGMSFRGGTTALPATPYGQMTLRPFYNPTVGRIFVFGAFQSGQHGIYSCTFDGSTMGASWSTRTPLTEMAWTNVAQPSFASGYVYQLPYTTQRTVKKWALVDPPTSTDETAITADTTANVVWGASDRAAYILDSTSYYAIAASRIPVAAVGLSGGMSLGMSL